MRIRFSNTDREIVERDLEEVENEFGFSFPRSFRDHYLKVNGGSPDNYLFKKGEEILVVNSFLSVKYSNGNLLFEEVVRELKLERAYIPINLYPFAIDPGGDYFCFSTRPVDVGSVWIFRGDFFDETDRASLYLCANLSEFLEGLVSDVEANE